jgi:hypothetical protein
VNVNIGIVTERGEILIAFIYKIVVTAFSDPPTSKAYQKFFPKVGISMKNMEGSRIISEKLRMDHAMMYSSILWSPRLLNKSVVE